MTRKRQTPEQAVNLLRQAIAKQEQMELIERVFRAAWAGRVQTAATDATALRRELAKHEARKQRVLGQMES